MTRHSIYPPGSLALTKQPGAKQPRAKCPPTPGEPSGDLDRANWMEEHYQRGLIQHLCPKCLLWHVWVKGTKANKKKAAMMRRAKGQV